MLCSYLDFNQRLSLENEKAGRLFLRNNFQRPTMYFSPYSVIVRVRIYFLLTYIHIFALLKSRFPGSKKPRGCAVFCLPRMERAKGIEPSYSAWEADVLPLNYARKVFILYRSSKQKSRGCAEKFRENFSGGTALLPPL